MRPLPFPVKPLTFLAGSEGQEKHPIIQKPLTTGAHLCLQGVVVCLFPPKKEYLFPQPLWYFPEAPAKGGGKGVGSGGWRRGRGGWQGGGVGGGGVALFLREEACMVGYGLCQQS